MRLRKSPLDTWWRAKAGVGSFETDIAFEAVGKDVPTTGIEAQPMDRQGEIIKVYRMSRRTWTSNSKRLRYKA